MLPWTVTCRSWLVALLAVFAALTTVLAGEAYHQDVIQPESPAGISRSLPVSTDTDSHALQDLHEALIVMQNRYFSLWLGKWETAIDWTAAVMGTHLAATLKTLSHSIEYIIPSTFDKTHTMDFEALMVESEINKYFGHLITYYFGQDYFAIRMQAYDDMLWVVLGWLDAIQLIREHSERHYPDDGDKKGDWHAQQFIPAFAHRARVFYELAEEGWDWVLCRGGMNWNPRLLPYKNAITNELYITASIGMYLYFPGDDNCSPFMGALERQHPDWNFLYSKEQDSFSACSDSEQEPEYDPIYLANAVDGYEWLANSGMMNDQGLYTDGFHISGYEQNHSRTECDERNEMVYTYNQGVILSGLRGLWEATGNLTYLSDAHELIGNVIRATGWNTTAITPVSFSEDAPPSHTERTIAPTSDEWAGLGAHGILTELCDLTGTCSQDGQTFKGIFFHHLTAFCAPLPRHPTRQGKTHYASPEVYTLHRNSCNEYAPWVVHNAQAALKTRNEEGKFGSWWGAEYGLPIEGEEDIWRRGALDYRNDPAVLTLSNFSAAGVDASREAFQSRSERDDEDPNERGRGRTVETQGGGVAIVRAMWEFLHRSGAYDGEVVGQEL